MGFLQIEELENLSAPITAGEIAAFGIGVAVGVGIAFVAVAT
jgi:hypothetical protein